MSDGVSDNEFATYRKLIIKQLETHEGSHKSHYDQINKLKTEMAVMKARAALIATFISLMIGGAGFVIKIWVK